MFGDDDEGSIARRGLEEALSCRDLLAPSPPRPTALARIRTRIAEAVTGLGRRLRRGIAVGGAAIGRKRPVAR
jgi:hypothetical protein